MPSKSALKRAKYRKIAKGEAIRAEYMKPENVALRQWQRKQFALQERQREANRVTMTITPSVHSYDVEVTLNRTNH